MVIIEIALATVVVVSCTVLAWLGYSSTGGTAASARAAAGTVVGRVAAVADQLSGTSGHVRVRIDVPDIGTYQGARWLIVAEGDGDIDVRPRSNITAADPGGRTEVDLVLSGVGSGRHHVEVTVYDADTVTPLARLSTPVVLPRSKGWWHALRSVFVGRGPGSRG